MTLRVAIFGATSAIAGDVARLYHARGARLVLVGRNADKLARLAAELKGSVVATIVQDFDRTDEAEACVRGAVTALGEIDVALIAHGLLGDQLASERQVPVAMQTLHTNALSVVALLVPLSNQLEAQRGGHLAVMSSVAAERGRPRNYTYAAAKAALNVYLQGVRSRLVAAGVEVHTLKLGPVDTPMTHNHEKNAVFARSPDVARAIVRAIDRGVDEVYVPGFWRLIMFFVRHMPEAVFQRLAFLSGR